MTEDDDLSVAVEQAQVRKQLEEAIAAERALRASESGAEAAIGEPAPGVWTPPRDPAATSSALKILARIAVFLVLLYGAYVLVREGSYIVFAPRMQPLAAVVPTGTVSSDQPITVGVNITNRSRRSDGSAFVVAAFSSGEEIEGPTVPVKAGDTVFLPVQVRLSSGDHVFTLIVFNSWRGVHRVRSFRGLSLGAAGREIEVEKIVAPESVAQGGSAVIEFSGANPGQRPELVVPVVAFRNANGTALVTQGNPVEIAARKNAALRVAVDTKSLAPGQYYAEVWVETRSATVIGHARYPVPIEVTQ